MPDPYVIAGGEVFAFSSRDAALLFAQAYREEMKSRYAAVPNKSPQSHIRDVHVELNPPEDHDNDRLWS